MNFEEVYLCGILRTFKEFNPCLLLFRNNILIYSIKFVPRLMSTDFVSIGVIYERQYQ